MIQDIQPKEFHNEYIEQTPKDNDIVFSFKERGVLMKNECEFPTYKEVGGNVQYLFQIDDQPYFLSKEELKLDGYDYVPTFVLRRFSDETLRFAVVTAYHLYSWYASTKYCGTCGHPLVHSTTERAMVCPDCGHVYYPTIAPAVIVGVVHNDSILMTRYANRSYKGHALIAGFCEIGETPEDTVRREVMEEVGLKVKNIRYYKSQPWGFDSNILMGFFAQLDGDDTISLDQEELAKARFIKREEITDQPDGLSLTNEMIIAFKNGSY